MMDDSFIESPCPDMHFGGEIRAKIKVNVYLVQGKALNPPTYHDHCVHHKS